MDIIMKELEYRRHYFQHNEAPKLKVLALRYGVTEDSIREANVFHTHTSLPRNPKSAKESKDADARATCRRGTWFFKQDGLWMALPPAADLAVESAHAAGHCTAHASFLDKRLQLVEYTYDLRHLRQKNTATGCSRDLRRVAPRVGNEGRSFLYIPYPTKDASIGGFLGTRIIREALSGIRS